MRMHGVAAALAVLVACGGPPSREAFLDDFAEIWCERQAECALGEFEDKYDDFDACYDDRFDDPKLPNGDDVGCEVDPDEAGDCLDWMRSTGCADWESRNVEDACDRVFVDC